MINSTAVELSSLWIIGNQRNPASTHTVQDSGLEDQKRGYFSSTHTAYPIIKFLSESLLHNFRTKNASKLKVV